MKDLLRVAVEFAVPAIDLMALVIIVIGTIEAFILGLRVMFVAPSGHDQRTAWLRYGRWLVAGLTFQLAADIIETAIAPGWQDIGQLAAIAAIRTFLNYFLERDLAEIRDRQRDRDESVGDKV